VTLKVLWPYITLKVRNDAGQTVLNEFYAGAPVPDNAVQEDVDRLVRKGALVEEGTPEADLLAVPAGTPIPGEPPNVPVTEQPSGGGSVEDRVARVLDAAGQSEPRADGRPLRNDSKSAWVDYAVSKRPEDVSEEDARAQAEGKSKADLVAEYGG
jgi:hypothetical protein